MYIDNPRLLKNEKHLSFSIFEPETSPDIEGYYDGRTITGFRIMGGQIHSPETQNLKTKKYVPLVYLPKKKAQALYQLVKNSGWMEEHKLGALLDERLAIAPMLLPIVDLPYVLPTNRNNVKGH
jgi:hypothetical protein